MSDFGALRALMRAAKEAGVSPHYARALIQGLDTSYEARMARAAEQGFEGGWYHSSLSDLDRFEPTGKFMGAFDAGISLADDPEVSNAYLLRYFDRDWQGNAFAKNVMPLMSAPGRNYEAAAHGAGRTKLPTGAPLPDGYVPDFVRRGYDSADFPDIISFVDDPDAGFHQVAHVSSYDGGADTIGYTERILNDPARVRSVHAMFNPRKRNSRDLLAAAPPAIGALGALELMRRREAVA